MNEMILCVIENDAIVEYSTAETDMLTTDISMDITDRGATIVWIRKKGDDAQKDILDEYHRRLQVNRIADGLGR